MKKRFFRLFCLAAVLANIWLMLPLAVQAAGSITIDPRTGKPGTVSAIAGNGFTPNTAGDIWFDSDLDNVIDPEENRISVTSASDGTIPSGTAITIPAVTKGIYYVKADMPSGGNIEASTSFVVVPGLYLNPSLVIMNTPTVVTISGGGFTGNTPGVIWFDSNNNNSGDTSDLQVYLTTTDSGAIPADVVLNIPGLPPAKNYYLRADIPSDGSIDTSAVFATASTTNALTVTKFDAIGSVLETQAISYQEMQDTLPVQGNGNTEYYCEGPYFDTSDFATLWDTAETGGNIDSRYFGKPRGTYIKDLCELVGGASPGDIITIMGSDGVSKDFDYESIYAPPPALGKMAVCWYNTEYGGYVPAWSEGMRLLFLVENTNPDGKLVFGNWDMHETLPRSRWYFYNGENPSSGGISLKYVSAIEIRQPQLISCDASGLVKDAFKPGEEVYVKGTGLTSNASYRLWIQPEPVTLAAYNSLDVPTLNSYRFNTASDPSGSQELVTTNADGNFNAVVVWNTSPGNSLSAKYDIIADNQSAGTAGQMDSADYIDNPGFEGFRIEVTDTVKAPAAAFAASPTSGVPPLTVNFTDLSSNSPTSWSWDFDNDGNSDSDVQNPSFTYNELGNYTVKLTVSNPAGSDNEIKINYISVHALDDYPDWDVNRDGEINIIDISSIARHLQETGAPGWIRADVNKDGIIDQDDIDIVVSHMRTSEIPAAPGITSFSPASAGQGSSVVITGTYFTGATAVSFGGMPAQSFTVNNSTQITARVAGGASGPVSVITLYGTAAKSGFTFIAAPSITSFSPASGSTDTTVRIYGTNFTGATRVSFGGTSASFFTVNSATQITATVGDGSSGQINVVTPGGTANSSSSFSYVAPGNPPTISSFYPSSAASGTLVTITGARLGNALSVSFGGVEAASISSNSNSTIVAEVAYGASGDVSVTTADGTASRAGFNYIQAPGISSFTPSQGKQGTAVTIYGSNFVGVTSVTFGGVSADFTIISSTRISAVVGNGASGAIRVTTAAGTTISYTNFTYIPPAALFSVNLSLPEKTVSPGDNFDIAVQINTGTNPVRGAGFALAYDKSKMQCLSVSEGDFFKAWAQLHNCSTMMFPSPAIDNYLGKASFSISIMGQTNGGPSGIGMVCVFHLTALSGITGQSILTFANTLVSDQYGNVLPNAAFQNGIVTFSNNLSTPSSSPFLTAAPSYNPPTPLPSGTVSEMVPGDKPSVAPTGMSPPSSSVPGQTAASSGTPSTAPENSQSGLPDAVFDLAGQINSQGIFINDFQDQQTINSNDIIARLDIVRGTAVSHPQGKPIEKIIISRTNTPPDLVAGGNIVIAAFQVAPDGCAFSQPISLTIKYYPGDIAVGFVEKDLVLTYKDPVSGKWMDAPSLVDPENHVITTQIDQLSPIAIVLRPTPALRWSIFAIIVAAEIVIGLIIVFYLLRRKRARA